MTEHAIDWSILDRHPGPWRCGQGNGSGYCSIYDRAGEIVECGVHITLARIAVDAANAEHERRQKPTMKHIDFAVFPLLWSATGDRIVAADGTTVCFEDDPGKRDLILALADELWRLGFQPQPGDQAAEPERYFLSEDTAPRSEMILDRARGGSAVAQFYETIHPDARAAAEVECKRLNELHSAEKPELPARPWRVDKRIGEGWEMYDADEKVIAITRHQSVEVGRCLRHAARCVNAVGRAYKLAKWVLSASISPESVAHMLAREVLAAMETHDE